MQIRILALLIFLSLFSCKTKHKITEREKVKETTSKTQTVKDVVSEDIAIKTDIKITSDAIIITENTEIELTQADANKEITITDALGNQTKIKGANVKLRTNEIAESKKDSLIDKTLITDKKTAKTDVNLNENATKDNTKRIAVSDVKTTSTWIYIALIVLGVVGVWFWFKRDKTLF